MSARRKSAKPQAIRDVPEQCITSSTTGDAKLTDALGPANVSEKKSGKIQQNIRTNGDIVNSDQSDFDTVDGETRHAISPDVPLSIDIEGGKTQGELNESIASPNDSFMEEDDDLPLDCSNDDDPKKKIREDSKIHPYKRTGGIEVFRCPLCLVEGIESRKGLTGHLRLHQNKEKRDDGKHLCCLCSHELSSNSSLERHLLTHTNFRPFSCHYCNKAFTTNGNLSRHIKTTHQPSADEIQQHRLAMRKSKAAAKKLQNTANTTIDDLPPIITREDTPVLKKASYPSKSSSNGPLASSTSSLSTSNTPQSTALSSNEKEHSPVSPRPLQSLQTPVSQFGPPTLTPSIPSWTSANSFFTPSSSCAMANPMMYPDAKTISTLNNIYGGNYANPMLALPHGQQPLTFPFLTQQQHLQPAPANFDLMAALARISSGANPFMMPHRFPGDITSHPVMSSAQQIPNLGGAGLSFDQIMAVATSPMFRMLDQNMLPSQSMKEDRQIPLPSQTVPSNAIDSQPTLPVKRSRERKSQSKLTPNSKKTKLVKSAEKGLQKTNSKSKVKSESTSANVCQDLSLPLQTPSLLKMLSTNTVKVPKAKGKTTNSSKQILLSSLSKKKSLIVSRGIYRRLHRKLRYTGLFFSCSDCPKRFNKTTGYLIHKSIVKRNGKGPCCSICHVTTSTSDVMVNHLKSHLKTRLSRKPSKPCHPVKQTDIYRCWSSSICQARFPSWSLCASHMRSQHRHTTPISTNQIVPFSTPDQTQFGYPLPFSNSTPIDFSIGGSTKRRQQILQEIKDEDLPLLESSSSPENGECALDLSFRSSTQSINLTGLTDTVLHGNHTIGTLPNNTQPLSNSNAWTSSSAYPLHNLAPFSTAQTTHTVMTCRPETLFPTNSMFPNRIESQDDVSNGRQKNKNKPRFKFDPMIPVSLSNSESLQNMDPYNFWKNNTSTPTTNNNSIFFPSLPISSTQYNINNNNNTESYDFEKKRLLQSFDSFYRSKVSPSQQSPGFESRSDGEQMARDDEIPPSLLKQGIHDDSGTYSDGDNPRRRLIRKKNSYKDAPKLITCPVLGCLQKFPWHSSLKRHIITHTEHKPYKCTRCHNSFSTKSNRERHMERLHGVSVKKHKRTSASYQTHNTNDDLLTDIGTALVVETGTNSTSGSSGNHGPGEGNLGLYSSDNSDHGDTESELKEEEILSMDNNDRQAETISTTLLLQAGAPQVEPNPERYTNITSTSVARKHQRQGGSRCTALTGPLSSAPSSTSPGSFLSTPSSVAYRPWIPEVDGGFSPSAFITSPSSVFNCPICGLTMKNEKALQKHRLKFHANVDISPCATDGFKCPLCIYSSCSRRAALEHLQTCHVSEWFMLTKKMELTQVDEVIARHHSHPLPGDSPTFPLSSALSPGGEDGQGCRQVECCVCLHRFWSYQDLQRHMRSHTGERPFLCPTCGKEFSLKHSMQRHMRCHLEYQSGSLVE